VFNPKLGAFAAGFAFILSLLIGLVNGSSLPALFLRPLILAILVFGLSVFISLLINRFLPELLDTKPPALDIAPGSRIDIREEAPAVPGGFYARPDDSDEGLDDISDRVATVPDADEGIDPESQNGYTEERRESAPIGTDGFDVLPDLESLAGAFLPSSGNKADDAEEYQSADAPLKPVGNKPRKLDGDFNPKDLAAGIRTILKKQEG
jgi:hypothetical protein